MGKRLITDLDVIKEHLKSYEAKSRNDFKWLEYMGDYFDYGFEANYDYVQNVELNSNLFKGRGIPQSDIANFLKRTANNGQIDLSYTNIPHVDILGEIANSMDGIQRNRPFSPIVIDTGPLEGNERRSKHLELLQQYLSTTVIPKYQEEATMRVFSKYGIQNPMQLNPDEQMQVQSEIQQMQQEITPERIDDYMRRDYQSPRSKQLTELLQVLSEEFDIKDLTDDGFQMALISGLEVYYQGIRGGQLVLELVNPKNIIYGDYDSCRWVQDAMWVKHCDNLPVVEILKRYGDELNSSQIRKIKDATVNMDDREDLENARLVGIMGDDSEVSDIDLRTMQGQWEYHMVKKKYGVSVNANILDVKHICFQSIDEAKYVTRIVDGKKRGFYTGRDYEINKLKGDIEVKEIKVPQVFEVTKIETGTDPIYVNKGEVPYSYRSLENPFKVQLPYIGAKYNKTMGNGEMVSQVDLGKQGQYKYNTTHAKMEQEESTDFGKVMSLVLSLKPSRYKVEEWLTMIRQQKLLLIGEAEGNGQLDPNALQAIRQIDLSTVDKIASYIAKLEQIRQETARAMRFNNAMLGQSSPYESIANQQNSISLSSNQTRGIYTFHDSIVEKLLTALLQTSLVYYKDKPFKRSWIMSDLSVGTLELDPDLIHASEVGVYLSLNIKDIQDTEQMKTDAHALIQTGEIDFEDWARIRMAKSTSELLNISRMSKRKRQEMMAQQQQAVQEAEEKARQFQMALKQMEIQAEMNKEQMNNQTKIQTATIGADQFRRAYDINLDNINDANQRMEMELKYKREKDREDRKLQLIKLAIEEAKVKSQSNRVKAN